MLVRLISFVGVVLFPLTSLAQESVTSSHTHQKFKGQVVVVTGASRGIGRGIAHQFALEGAQVVLVARDEALLQEVASSMSHQDKAVCAISGDVSCPEDMQRVLTDTIQQYGKIDILCHNAGVYPHARLENMTLEEWESVLKINLTGTFLAVKACIPHMKSQRKGKIVITSSISGPITALPGYSHYTASKGGIAGFVKTAAVELAKYNININAVEPGNILTEGLGEMGAEHMSNMLQAIPLGRLGTPEDVAHAILFLASNEASFITGQSIVVDGGQVLPESHYAEY